MIVGTSTTPTVIILHMKFEIFIFNTIIQSFNDIFIVKLRKVILMGQFLTGGAIYISQDNHRNI